MKEMQARMLGENDAAVIIHEDGKMEFVVVGMNASEADGSATYCQKTVALFAWVTNDQATIDRFQEVLDIMDWREVMDANAHRKDGDPWTKKSR